MRTLPLFLLAASPAFACGPGSGPPLENLLFIFIFFAMNPFTWLVLFGLFVVVLIIAEASRNARSAQSTRTLR
ncbi:MAG: hypothetical protein Q8L14_19410 [Myxococcales bacterium]|nr:hypothetical protein [Myxococcales bacterium]